MLDGINMEEKIMGLTKEERRLNSLAFEHHANYLDSLGSAHAYEAMEYRRAAKRGYRSFF